MAGEFWTQLSGHSSRTITRQAPLVGLQAVNSVTFWRRLARLNVTSEPSGDQPTP